MGSRIERVILKHLTGSQSGKEERIELGRAPEILIGRHPASRVRFDADQDDLVSGRHAQITQDAADPCVFMLTDLGSRNGTFVNSQKVTSPVRLLPGDVLQFARAGRSCNSTATRARKS
jgi:pSer/pThr/pTyr-binding forkhead associated (FHA) protein